MIAQKICNLIHIAVDNFCFNLKYFDTDVFSSDRERIISLVSYATTQSKFYDLFLIRFGRSGSGGCDLLARRRTRQRR